MYSELTSHTQNFSRSFPLKHVSRFPMLWKCWHNVLTQLSFDIDGKLFCCDRTWGTVPPCRSVRMSAGWASFILQGIQEQHPAERPAGHQRAHEAAFSDQAGTQWEGGVGPPIPTEPQPSITVGVAPRPACWRRKTILLGNNFYLRFVGTVFRINLT